MFTEQARAARWASSGLNGLCAARRADYDRWSNMMYRCYNPNYPKYRYWGGRGIRVCDRWHSFLAFLEDIDQLLGPCPEGYTLGRIDPDDNYEPGRVQWETYSTQNRKLRRQQGTTSQYRGVRWEADRGKWLARISVGGRAVNLGRFVTEEEAHQAYQTALAEITDS